jgi:hypothetical protein
MHSRCIVHASSFPFTCTTNICWHRWHYWYLVGHGNNDLVKELNKAPKYPNTTGFEPCATTDPEIWFPERSNQYLKIAALAKSLCQTCPIMYECAEYAINTDVVGIWGATDEKQRHAIQKANKIEPFRFVKMTIEWLDKMNAKA